MLKSSTKINVRYSETDQMGFVYYGNYAQYLEVGRVDAMKQAGISYRNLEERGFALPVRELKISYRKAARYDDELTIETIVNKMPDNRITFNYKIYRESELLAEASTLLFFINKHGRACKPPSFFIDHLKPFFS